MAKKTTKLVFTPTIVQVEHKPYPKTIDKRFHQLRFNMEDNKLNSVFIQYLPNVRYLTNYSGSAGALLVTEDEIHFFTDDRYEEQVKTELFDLHNLTVHITRDIWQYIIDQGLIKKIEVLGVEAENLSYEEAIHIRQKVHTTNAKFKPISCLVERYTQPKSPEEIESIKKSCNISERVFEHILTFIKPGITELDIAIEIDYQSRLFGSEGPAFDTIVTSGARGALVHGQPSAKKIKKGDIVLMDFGGRVNGFCSDISRTICVGKATKEQKDMYTLLYTAMNKACEEARPSMRGHLLDKVARDMVANAGFGDNFKHSLGHGLGLVCHEKPIITFRMEDQVIPEDVVLALEPGIYLPDICGMRVEDDVLVAKGKNIKLTNAPDTLISV
ncbi:MAG: Xaa-Pro peptidase family protein [Ignavibacteria bacterium]|jgi:Xaa-Pro aminopeptidase|nr:Xaa-Pro peptidase family protein [Ignavibacteria bacterium]